METVATILRPGIQKVAKEEISCNCSFMKNPGTEREGEKYLRFGTWNVSTLMGK